MDREIYVDYTSTNNDDLKNDIYFDNDLIPSEYEEQMREEGKNVEQQPLTNPEYTSNEVVQETVQNENYTEYDIDEPIEVTAFREYNYCLKDVNNYAEFVYELLKIDISYSDRIKKFYQNLYDTIDIMVDHPILAEGERSLYQKLNDTINMIDRYILDCKPEDSIKIVNALNKSDYMENFYQLFEYVHQAHDNIKNSDVPKK